MTYGVIDLPLPEEELALPVGGHSHPLVTLITLNLTPSLRFFPENVTRPPPSALRNTEMAPNRIISLETIDQTETGWQCLPAFGCS